MNRCLVEGRERFRRYLSRRDGGARCTELAPIISAFVDDEAEPADVAALREHLRTCAHCRATLRAYRAAPRAAAALAPVLPLRGPLAERLHDAYAALATRVGGGSPTSESTLGGLVATGGTRGAGMTALAKVLAICAGTVGGAAACVATGVVPAPLLASPDHHPQPPAKVVHHHPRQHLAEEVETQSTPTYEPAPPSAAEEVAAEPDPGPQEKAKPEPHKPKPDHEEAAPVAEEPTSSSSPPESKSGATEFVEPAPEPTPVETPSTSTSASGTPSSSSPTQSSSSAGTAAGEFGP